MTLDFTNWHLEDRKVRCTYNHFERETGMRRTMYPAVHYGLTKPQYEACRQVALKMIAAAQNMSRKAAA